MLRSIDPARLRDDDLQLALSESFGGNAAKNLVPAYRFAIQHAYWGWRMGEIELRLGNTHHIRMYAGHIGYEIFPAYRGHHYAARAVKLLLPLARTEGIETVWITCNPDNYASRRTCELAGFELVEIVDLPPTSDMYREGERQKCRYRRFAGGKL
jgi:predicted acetyltransferase